MSVKLPATLNIQPSSLGEMHKVCGYHYFVTKKLLSGDAQCYLGCVPFGESKNGF